MSVCQVAISLLLGGRCLLVANFSERRKAEVRRIVLPRLSENPQARASLLTMSRVIAAWMKASPVEHILS